MICHTAIPLFLHKITQWCCQMSNVTTSAIGLSGPVLSHTLNLWRNFPGIDIVNTFRTVILWLLSAPWSLTMPLLRANIIPLLSFSCRYWLTGLYSSLKQLQEYILFCSPLRAFAPWSLKDLNIYFPSDFSTIPLRQMISCDLSLLLRLWSLSYPGSISAFVVLQSNTTACHTCIVCILDI